MSIWCVEKNIFKILILLINWKNKNFRKNFFLSFDKKKFHTFKPKEQANFVWRSFILAYLFYNNKLSLHELLATVELKHVETTIFPQKNNNVSYRQFKLPQPWSGQTQSFFGVFLQKKSQQTVRKPVAILL